MRYTEIDLQIEDIMWFGVDTRGHILAFTSGGCGSVPEFVCQSKEETEELEMFFLESLDRTTWGKLLIEADGSALAEDGAELAGKGIYCFDVSFDEEHAEEYVKIAVPEKPICVEDLPAKIQNFLKHHNIDADAAADKYIQIKHAY